MKNIYPFYIKMKNKITKPTLKVILNLIQDLITSTTGARFQTRSSLKNILKLTLITLITLAFLNTPNQAQVAEQDSLALVALHEANPENALGWDLEQPINTWEGVVIASNRVIRLLLNGKNLSNIPNDLNALDAIKKVHLFSNRIRLFPAFNWPNLEELLLHQNELEELEVGDWESLRVLYLYNNNLAELETREWSELRYFHVNHNQLEVLESREWPQLIRLHAHNNGLIEFVVQEWPRLESLRLQNNQLTSFRGRDWPVLRELLLHQNELEELEVGDWESLRVLYLYNNNLAELETREWSELRYFHVNHNQLEVLESREWPQLIRLHAHNNGLIEFVVQEWPRLESLRLQNNQLTSFRGRDWPVLRELLLHQNELEELEVGDWESLRVFYVYNNNLAELETREWLELRYFHVNHNQLEALQTREWSQLIRFYADDNRLVELTEQEWAELEWLHLHNNQLTTFVGRNWSKLKQLLLHQNELEEIEVGDWESLRVLYLHNNNLAELETKDWPSLRYLHINDNKLTFDDVEYYIDLPLQRYIYSRQNSFGFDTTIYIREGENYLINLGIDEEIEDNEYVWYKDNEEISRGNENSFLLENMVEETAGIYRVTVTNPRVPRLTLQSHPITLAIDDRPTCLITGTEEIYYNGQTYTYALNSRFENEEIENINWSVEGGEIIAENERSIEVQWDRYAEEPIVNVNLLLVEEEVIACRMAVQMNAIQIAGQDTIRIFDEEYTYQALPIWAEHPIERLEWQVENGEIRRQSPDQQSITVVWEENEELQQGMIYLTIHYQNPEWESETLECPVHFNPFQPYIEGEENISQPNIVYNYTLEDTPPESEIQSIEWFVTGGTMQEEFPRWETNISWDFQETEHQVSALIYLNNRPQPIFVVLETQPRLPNLWMEGDSIVYAGQNYTYQLQLEGEIDPAFQNVQLYLQDRHIADIPLNDPQSIPILFQAEDIGIRSLQIRLGELKLWSKRIIVLPPGEEDIRVVFPDIQARFPEILPMFLNEVNEVLAGENPTKHYVRSYTFHEETYLEDLETDINGRLTPDNFDPENVSIQTQYLDGLGRKIQENSWQASPQRKDAIQIHSYDLTGTENIQYQSYVSDSQASDYQENAFESQRLFYQNDQSSIVENRYPYSLTLPEKSPLRRAEKSFAPGDSWMGSIISENPKNTQVEYSLNHDEDNLLPVIDWEVVNAQLVVNSDMPYHSEATLRVTKVTDEHHHSMYEYTNGLGQTVLKRAIHREGEETHYLDTYYVYDHFGQLRYTIPPKATKAIANNFLATHYQSIIEQLGYAYRYDARGRKIEEKIPSAQPTYFVYDRLDRPVLMQDGQMRLHDQWLYTKYDRQDRKVITGLFTDPQGRDREELANTIKDWENLDVFLTEENPQWQDPKVGAYSDLAFPPAENCEPLSIQYFDEYIDTEKEFVEVQAEQLNPNYSAPALYLQQLKGLPTVSKTKILDSDQWLETITFYDEEQRVIQVQSENHKGGVDIATSQYDYSGQTMATYLSHHNPVAEQRVTLQKVYAYDHAGRLMSIQHRLNDGEFKEIASYQYDELGQQIGKSVANGLQEVSYEYHQRGWLKKINDPESNATLEKLFHLSLQYDQSAEGFEQYNGQIGEAHWKSVTDQQQRNYRFRYDDLNQLSQALFSGAGGENYSVTGFDSEDRETGIRYDYNGNIKQLSRYGLQNVENQEFGIIDKLNYSYANGGNSNLLTNVFEQAEIQGVGNDYKKAAFPINNRAFEYNTIGALSRADKRGITSIGYNHLQLPTQVMGNIFHRTSYTYDASGMRLQRRVHIDDNNNPEEIYDYIAGFVYKNNELQFLQMEEGRIVFPAWLEEEGNANADTPTYEYHYSDHLGNLRLAYRGEVHGTMTAEVQSAEEEEAFFMNLALYRDNEQSRSGRESVRLANSNPEEEASYVFTMPISAQMGYTYTASVYIAAEGAEREFPDGRNRNANDFFSSFSFTGGALPKASSETGNAKYPLQTGVNLLGLAQTRGIFPGGGNKPLSTPLGKLAVTLYSANDQVLEEVIVQADAWDSWQKLEADLTLGEEWEEGSYIKVKIWAESSPVWFDDLKVASIKVVQETHYYPFGQKLQGISRNYLAYNYNWQFQGKEREQVGSFVYDDFGSRFYDTQLGRWNATDPQSQFHSPYLAMGNNPISYIDPNGELAWFVPIIIGAVAGAYSGGVAANGGQYNPGKWDWQSGRTWGYMAGGAVVGGASGALGHVVATSGGVFANTLSIATASFVNSIGTSIYQGGYYGQSEIGVSLGVASYSFTQNQWGYLGKKGNSTLENIGYGLGLFANLSDTYSFIKGAYGNKASEIDLVTKNDPIGHSALVDENGNNIVSVGPDWSRAVQGDSFWNAPGMNDWYNHLDDTGIDKLTVSKIKIHNVRLDKVNEYVKDKLTNAFRYKAIGRSCVTETSRALLKAGVLNMPFLRHPSLLQFQMFLRQNTYFTSFINK